MTSRRRLTLIGLCALLLAASSGCRPEACARVEPVIEQAETSIHGREAGSAAARLTEIEAILADSSIGYLEGFREKTAALRILLEEREAGQVDEGRAWASNRRADALSEGWLREAAAVKKRCKTQYLIR